MSAPVVGAEGASLAAVRAALADGATPADVVRATYRRIAAADVPNAWIVLRPEAEVVAEAEALDGAVPPDAPLYGVPFAVKGNIDVAGLVTTAGCPAYGRVPATSAPVVERLRAAGALLVGTTTMDQFATGLVGTRSPWGPCRSVLDPERISGGSSSGSGVVVAAGLVPFALGTDTAGSGRVPAACNGIVGAKPTRGRVPIRGIVPACASLDCVAVLATSVDDARDVVAVLEGFDPEDVWSRRIPAGAGLVGGAPPSPVQVGVVAGDGLAPCDAATAAAYRLAVEAWSALPGVEVVEVDLAPFLAAGQLLYEGAFVAERYSAVGAFIEAHPDEVDPTVGGIIGAAADLPAAQVFRDGERLAALARATEPTWEEVDVLVTPTVPRVPTLAEVAADPVGVNTALGTYTNFVNLLDLCAVAVPAGPTVGAVPLGITVVAPSWADGRAVAAASALGSPATGGG